MTSGLRSRRGGARVVYESPLRKRAPGTPFLTQSLPRPRRGLIALALGAIVLVAIGNFLWQLGTPNFFADEVLSIWNATPSLSHVITAVNKTETNPWTYFLLLHGYLGYTGAQSEVATRISSVIGGIALVPAVFWLASAFLRRWAALGAAALCALAPLVLTYAQEVRGYIFVMLAVAVATAATIRAVDRQGARNRLLVAGAVGAIAALWLHYFAVLVIGPLCVWLLRQPSLSRRQRGIFVAACALGGALTVPMFIEQLKSAAGLAGLASLKWWTAAAVIGTPFDGRFENVPTAIRIIGVVVAVVSILRLLSYDSHSVRHSQLLGVLALVPIVAIVIAGAVGQDVVSTRYSALAAPIEIVAIVAAIATFRALPAIALSAATAFLVVWGLAVSHSKAGFYPPSKQVMAYIGRHRQPGDLVALTVRLGVNWPFEYYGWRSLHPPPRYIVPHDTRDLLAALHNKRRMWFISMLGVGKPSDRAWLTYVNQRLGPYGYRPLYFHKWTTAERTFTYLAVPSGS